MMEALNMLLLRARELELFNGEKTGGNKHMEEVTDLFFTDDILIFLLIA